MADLTYLNEASVVHNLRLRYEPGDIYVRAFLSLYLAPNLLTMLDLFGIILGCDQSIHETAYLYGRDYSAIPRQRKGR
jgi:hypothetical protein